MTVFKNIDLRIIDKPGFESWYFYAEVEDLEPLRAWLRDNLTCYEANSLISYCGTYHTVYVRFSCSDDAALFKLSWC